MVLGRGWPVFGEFSSQTEWGSPYATFPAVPFSASDTWVLDSLQIGAFGPVAVTVDGGIRGDDSKPGAHRFLKDSR